MQSKKLLLLSSLAIGALLLSNCSPKTGKSTAASTTTKSEVHYTDAPISEGETIYKSNCGKCHKLIAPADKSLDKWNSVLPSMVHKAKLTDEQGALVRAYVMANLKA